MHSYFIPSGNGPAIQGKVVVAKPQFRPDAEVAAQEMACSICKFNVTWNECAHLDQKCQPCKARKDGGLKAALRLVGFKCPLEK